VLIISFGFCNLLLEKCHPFDIAGINLLSKREIKMPFPPMLSSWPLWEGSDEIPASPVTLK